MKTNITEQKRNNTFQLPKSPTHQIKRLVFVAELKTQLSFKGWRSVTVENILKTVC